MIRVFLIILFGAGLLGSCGPSMPASPQAVPASSGFDATLNQFRASIGQPSVQRSAPLNRAAQAHAEDMVARGYFGHRSPDGPNGVSFADRARAAGCNLRAAAENIARGQRSEAEVFRAWEGSRGHRDNMAGRSYRVFGLGRAGDTWVMVLADAC